MTPRVLRLPLLLTLPPAFLLLLLISVVGRDLPVWDEWVVWGELLMRMKTGIFALSDLWAQQNEQRNLPPRLVDLALMPFFRLNRFADYFLNFLLAACSCFALCRLYLKTLGDQARGIRLFGISAIALFCFSLTQWETFLVGLNLAQSCTTLGMALGVLLLSGAPVTPPRLLCLFIIGLCASFSIINGLFYWLALLPAAAFADGRPAKSIRISLWLLAGAACWIGYFYGYVAPEHHPGILQTLGRPLHLFGYFFATLGAACISDPELWFAAFGIGLAACLILLRDLTALRQHTSNLRALLPWLCLLFFALLTAGAISAGRSLYRDIGHALQSRYVTLCLPFWIALLALDAFTSANVPQTLRMRRLRICFWAMVFSAVVVTNLGLFFHLQGRGATQDAMRRELFRLQDETLLAHLFPDPAYLATRLPLFLERRLSPYTDIKPFNAYSLLAAPPKHLEAKLHMTPVKNGLGGLPGFQLHGKIFTGQLQRTAEKIFLTENDRIVHVGTIDTNGDFALFLPVTQLAPGSHRLQTWALMPDGALAPLGEELTHFSEYTPQWPLVRKYFYFPTP